uniref:FLYWCH-type domain-containing protein n=1 Tax=Steinernema glaseri TaxID=37863 RepID=A0A1I7Z997_9BILA
MQQQETEGESAGSSAAGSPLPVPRRSAIQWRLVGVYSSEEETAEIRRAKVSKRKTDVLRHGRKVTYRCNSWKRTRCPYQMYALHTEAGVELFETSAKHRHDVIHKKKPELSLVEEQDETPEDVLRSVVKTEHNSDPEGDAEVTGVELFETSAKHRHDVIHKKKPELSLVEEQDETPEDVPVVKTEHNSDPEGEAEDTVSTSSKKTFKLADHALTLLDVAREMDLSVSFNLYGSHEFVFSSSRAPHNVQVVFEDGEEAVRVVMKVVETEVHEETWMKSCWPQFLWALRGKCGTVLVQDRS